MQHSDHLSVVVQAIAADQPVPLCPECHAIVESWIVAGEPIKMETLDD